MKVLVACNETRIEKMQIGHYGIIIGLGGIFLSFSNGGNILLPNPSGAILMVISFIFIVSDLSIFGV